jgi:hypothetical protein
MASSSTNFVQDFVKIGHFVWIWKFVNNSAGAERAVCVHGNVRRLEELQ